MTRRVEIYGLENGEDVLFGYIVLTDGVFSCVPELPVLEDILEKPIFLCGGEDLYANDDPEKFLENLCRHYKSYGMRASTVQEPVK